MSRHTPDDLDQELHNIFAQATAHITPRHDLVESVQQRLAEGRSARSRRTPAIAATLSVLLVVALFVGVFAALKTSGEHPLGTGGGSTPSPALRPFSVSSVGLAVNPDSIAGKTCGSAATFTYTATFHIPSGTAGGTIQFAYTLNNGRSQTPATVTAAPGATSVAYTFTSSGVLPADHTYPAPAQVMVTSPNSVLSPSVTPAGTCVAPGPLQVTSVDIAVSPASVAGMRCGSAATVTYTATFHLAANGPGGTIHFYYTINNGRGSTPATLDVAPGQTTAIYTFNWSGSLPPDHTYPAPGGVIVSSPNTVSSPLVGPSGACS